MFKIFSIGLVLALLTVPVAAETMITCGASEGYAYYLPQGLTGKVKAGWEKDKVSIGSIALTKNGNKVDILFKDVLGHLKSASSNGAKVTLLGFEAPNATVLASYKETMVEIYTFDLKGKNLVWSQHKYGTLLNKGATYFAKCY
ncbi:MAG: hypothetical protein HOF05_11285 [Rhodospirillales bacterium]|nr:hypothetical protein [Rhodospirillales bacterium]